MKTTTLMYRPQDLPKRWSIKERRKYGQIPNYNFVNRVKWIPAGWKLNKQVIGGVHKRLHYLACHSPDPIQKKWNKAYKVFYKQHFGTDNATGRYLNNWSCHSWM